VSILKDKVEIEIQEAELGIMRALVKFPPVLRWALIIAILATIPSYFIAKQVAYKLWQARDKQYTLTAKPSFDSFLPIKIKSSLVLQTGPNQYSVAVEASNENLDLSAGNAPYEFRFYDAAKRPVLPESGQISGRTYFLPNQTKYLITTRISSKQPIARAEAVFPPDLVWKKKADLPKIKLNITGLKTSQQASPPAFAVDGFVENTSSYELKQVRLVFLVYDINKKILAVSERNEFALRSGENRAYKQLWPDQSFPDAASIQVSAETNTLDQANLRLEKEPVGPGSNLGRPEIQQ